MLFCINASLCFAVCGRNYDFSPQKRIAKLLKCKTITVAAGTVRVGALAPRQIDACSPTQNIKNILSRHSVFQCVLLTMYCKHTTHWRISLVRCSQTNSASRHSVFHRRSFKMLRRCSTGGKHAWNMKMWIHAKTLWNLATHIKHYGLRK